jgi:hypothetical protein
MEMTIPRANHALAAIVDQGILIAAEFGYSMGCMYMRNHSVPFEVALRVLSRPELRRKYD